jgi:FMN phosphatase YigB (HAD superfamily)
VAGWAFLEMDMICLFDCFGTVFNMSQIPKEDLRYYGSILKKPVWEPLNFPKYWQEIPPHPDSEEGIDILKSKGHKCVALSNAPHQLMRVLSANANIYWDHIIGLEEYKIYKPNRLAYLTACAELDCKPSDCTMVTANKTFGDIEGAKSVGMFAKLIRNEWCPDIMALARNASKIRERSK